LNVKKTTIINAVAKITATKSFRRQAATIEGIGARLFFGLRTAK
jgi:hypothetical protein